MTGDHRKQIGAVAIGRNEGERLRVCLESLIGNVDAVVYVDSGSTDGSVALARGLGASVLALDMSIPFTAARARNEGFARLSELLPDIEYVQFVDGDCEVVAGWLERARTALDDNPDVAVVCGRRRERHPDRSIYNALCDIEWDTPPGEAESCGGDALMRVAAFREAGGYNPGLIAGEEPEFCFRIRANGWRILRLPAEMTLHDAAITRFGQWWKRTLRAGHAYAQNRDLHGRSDERFKSREVRSIVIWALALPAAIGALAALTPWGLLAAAAYPAQAARIALRTSARGVAPVPAIAYGFSCVFGKFPMALGVLKYHWTRISGKGHVLIEYK